MIGVASPSFCFAPFSEIIEAISEQFEMWEILPEGKHSLDACYDEIADATQSYDLKYQMHAPMSDVNIGSIYDPMRRAAVAEVRRTIEACGKLGITTLTVHPGFVNGIAFLRRSMVGEFTKRSLVELTSVAENNGVTLAVENMPSRINATCTTAEELMDVVRSATLGICFDMGHANTAGQMGELLEQVSLFRNVHLHNNDGTWDQHDVIDRGSADLVGVLSSIERGGYSGNYVIESTDLESALESKQVLQKLLV